MALDWLTRVNYKPPMLGICVNNAHASNVAIRDTGEFSVNVPSTDMVDITDCTGLVSGRQVNKSGLFEVFYGKLEAAPMIKTCPLSMECKVIQTIELPTNTFFISEIINIYCEEQFLSNGKPDVKKINPFVLTMPDNKYWAIGDFVGKAWSAGKVMRDKLKEAGKR
jgi:flavin reductase (DIM6/NTAB) family NADH-FMN oxidoreductase RutF